MANPASPFERLAFRHPWRPYQQRVLDAVRLHLADRRLHVVAAPGSGKTTLGLEIFRLLGVPALVLSPTRTIRDQWIARLGDFLPEGAQSPPEWVSSDLRAPGLLTSCTYQALHSQYRELESRGAEEGEDESDDGSDAELLEQALTRREVDSVIERLKAAGTGVLILDEAHHLRAEWWKALARILEGLPELRLVSLTATPPYDVAAGEWSRYETLCGPIDEEISVPELVKAGTLCPHQDYLWTVVPTESQQQFVAEYVASVDAVCDALRKDDTFEAAVLGHAWIADATVDADAVFDDPRLATALCAWIAMQERPLPDHLMTLLDLTPEDLPAFDPGWWQLLLRDYLLRPEAWPADDATTEHRESLARELRARGLLWRRELRLTESRLVKRHLTLSPAKLDACAAIHRLEREQRGADLRMVILTDYIRDEGLRPGATADEEEPLGAWPVMRRLLRDARPGERETLALLTGRVVVVHESIAALLASREGKAASAGQPLDAHPDFRLFPGAGSALVAPLTALLSSGRVQVLVGTRALLGEGWDAPPVNALVLASFVGSYMLTNQMRGRAIRTDPASPRKVASIWHLVAIALDRRRFRPPDIHLPGLMDWFELSRRFQTFVGLHAGEPVIENGLDRLRLPMVEFRRDRVTGATESHLSRRTLTSPDALEEANREMAGRRRQLDSVARRWQEAIEAGAMGRVVPSITAPPPPGFAGFHLRNTLTSLALSALAAFLVAAQFFLPNLQTGDWRIIMFVLGFAGFAGLLFTLPRLYRTGKLWIAHLPVDGTVHQIGLAVRDALCASGIVEASALTLRVRSVSHEGQALIWLEGGDFHTQSLFADCVGEVLGPVENPRYLITRQGRRLGRLRTDYHAVPARLGARKEHASLFQMAWERRVGPGELIYTRTPETRPVLLRARARAFSNAARVAVERADRWF